MKSMPHLAELLMKAKAAIEQSQDLETLESARIKFLGKKGFFTRTTAELRHLLPEARPAAGLIINQAKRDFLQALAVRKGILEQLAGGVSSRMATEALDTSLPGRRMENGGLHPVTLTTERIENFFSKLGFSLAYGPEIEDDYHN